MCRLYRSKNGEYVRVCYRVRGLRGHKMGHGEALSNGWKPGAHVKKRRLAATRGTPAKRSHARRLNLIRDGGIYGPCTDCGARTRDEVCDDCKPDRLARTQSGSPATNRPPTLTLTRDHGGGTKCSTFG